MDKVVTIVSLIETHSSLRTSLATVIDNLLTPDCLSELRRLALEGTIFYDGKKSYVGAYIDQGMGESPWLLQLSEEWRARFPKILNFPLSTSWFYKYDSVSSEAGGIGIHAGEVNRERERERERERRNSIPSLPSPPHLLALLIFRSSHREH